MKLTNPEIRIEPTNYCNSKCVMCPREKLTRTKGVMDFQLFKDIIDNTIGYGITNVFLGGYGETLMDPHIIKRVEYVKKYNLFANFISNGALMDTKMAEGLLNAGLDEVRFSFYGSSKEIYETVHKGLNFETTRRNIEGLINLRERLNKKTPEVYVFFLILEQNSYQIEDFKKMWEGTVDAVEVWRPHNFGDGREYRGLNEMRESCGRPQRGPIQVQWDGTLIPCCWDYNGCMVLGDLKKNTLEQILKGEAYNNIRDAHNKGDFKKFPFCDKCDQLNKKKDALVYSTRHNLPVEEAVKLTNSSLFSLKNKYDNRLPAKDHI